MADIDVQDLLKQIAAKDAALREAQAKVEEREAENYKYRDQKRDLMDEIKDLKKQNEALKGGTVPEGATVLDAQAAKAFEAYKSFGSVDDLKKRLDAASEATAKLAHRERQDLIADVAGAAGANAALLQEIAADTAFVVKEVMVDGEAEKKAFAVEDGKEVPLKEYYEARKPGLVEVLFKEQSNAARTGQRPFVPQRPASGPASQRTVTDDEIANQHHQQLGGVFI